MKKLISLIILMFISLNSVVSAQIMPPSMEESMDEPVKYIGERQPDKKFFDGNLPHAVGVHHYQVFRANRSNPINGDKVGWTYNHQPFLCYWNNKFYIQYLSNVHQEHTPPGRSLIMDSEDGQRWSNPKIVFPEYSLPEINFEEVFIPAGTKSVMHQRMGFYVAPNGKLLTLGFYSYCQTPRSSPNAGNGLGRVVREIKKDGSFGPIYFIRYNRHAGWNESNTNYPFYKESSDKEFLKSCEALLADKLITLQWWEEDRAEDGFYTIDPSSVKDAAHFSRKSTTSEGAGKAFNFFHRPDSVVVGIWKNQYSALSNDNGRTWTYITKNSSLTTDGAKTWGQKTKDGKFVIVHNQSPTFRNRFPMTSIVSEDGHAFYDLLCLRGEVPLKRYQGLHKRIGPQYYRGIVEGNGNPPGNDVWVVYSMNKEDIWISKIRVPITGKVDKDVNEDFENLNNISDLGLWNVYNTIWASSSIVVDPTNENNKCLELKDEDPYDYAKVECVFPESKKTTISFRLNMLEVPLGYSLHIEVQDQKGNRPIRLRFESNMLNFDLGRQKVDTGYSIERQKWYNVLLNINSETQSYSVKVDGKAVVENINFDAKIESLERLEIRTGPFRGMVSPMIIDSPLATAGYETEDLPGGETKSLKSVYLIDDLLTKGEL